MGKIEKHFANLIQRLAGSSDPEVVLAARLVSNYCGDGHACVDLGRHAGLPLPVDWLSWSSLQHFPPLQSWRQKLEGSGVVGAPGSYFPLILDESGKLYLQRYYDYENIVAEYVRRNGLNVALVNDLAALHNGLEQLFGFEKDVLDWQQVAAIAAVYKSICVISGGPGTGKTTTVAKIVALLADQEKGDFFRVALVAPTGKASAKLFDSIRSVNNSKCAEIFDREEVIISHGTLHRLLGLRPGMKGTLNSKDNPLPFEVIVVDEASMVDLPLMALLMLALADNTRLILLGDREQLASVEPGSVFGDLCPDAVLLNFTDSFREIVRNLIDKDLPSEINSPNVTAMVDSMIQLERNYRFSTESGIHKVINAVRHGDAGAALAVFDDINCQDMIWHDVPSPKKIVNVLADLVKRGIIEPIMVQHDDFSFKALENSCLLCALRKGPYGVEEINSLARHVLVQKGKIPKGKKIFPGLPLMVVRNDYSMGLFNGDVGLVVRDDTVTEGFSVLFPGGKEGPRKISPALLPPTEPVFAMTVHKSQGMEFDHVFLILPDRSSPVLTRELLYTAISRARKTVEVWGNRGVFEEAILCRVNRESGLGMSLWGES